MKQTTNVCIPYIPAPPRQAKLQARSLQRVLLGTLPGPKNKTEPSDQRGNVNNFYITAELQAR